MLYPRASDSPVQIAWADDEREILRELARRYADIAALPVQEERRDLWTRLNGLERVRPLIWFDEYPWHELESDPALQLQCTGAFTRLIETELRRTLYLWDHVQGDMVVEPVIHAPLAIEDSGFGIQDDAERRFTDSASTVVSRHFNPVLRTEDDLERIRTPRVTHDQARSASVLDAYRDVFDGIVAVESRGAAGFWFSPWDQLVQWTGVTEVLTDLIDRPDFIHAAVERLTQANLDRLDQYRDLGLLSRNDTNVRIGSGAYGYSAELPRDDSDPDHPDTPDMWGSAAAQIFGAVSPAMHQDFALDYERRWLDRWGLTYYGCCDALHDKLGLLAEIPNLRKVSVSPWWDMERPASDLSDRLVFSIKPNPAIFIRERWSSAVAREELEHRLEPLRHCAIEIVMKDISTVRHEPERLWDWARIVAEVTAHFRS